MDPATIEATFPNGQKLPQPIRYICEYLERQGYPISGCFELSVIGVADLRGWFKDDPSACDSFLPFGRDACGVVYALWLVDGLPPEAAPVVMFGSECALEVLAVDAEQFVRLLCLGYSEIGLNDPEELPTDYDEAAPFRRFMLNRYSFSLPRTAAAIVDEARARYPGFAEWVQSRRRDGRSGA